LPRASERGYPSILLPGPLRTPGFFRTVFRGNLPVTIGIQPPEYLPPLFFGKLLENPPFAEFHKVQPPAAVHIQLAELPQTSPALPADFMDLPFVEATVAIPVKSGENPFAFPFRKARKPWGREEFALGNHPVTIGIHTPEHFPALAKRRTPVLPVRFLLLAIGAFLPPGTFPIGTLFPLRQNG